MKAANKIVTKTDAKLTEIMHNINSSKHLLARSVPCSAVLTILH